MTKTMIIYGDGVHDDSESLQACVDGKADLVFPDGKRFYGFGMPGRKHMLSRPLEMGDSHDLKRISNE